MLFFFFNDTATTEIYTLSLHDALPISSLPDPPEHGGQSSKNLATQRRRLRLVVTLGCVAGVKDRKSTRLNSSHSQISYAVFCLKTKEMYMNGLVLRGPHFPVMLSLNLF